MKITFEAGVQSRTEIGRTGQNRQESLSKSLSFGIQSAYQVDLLHGGSRIWEKKNHGGLGKSGQGKSLEELRQELSVNDVDIQKDYKVLMSHTMSEEDFARLEEEGFRFENLDSAEAVTIIDRIKVELARSGQDVIGYTDTVDVETLSAIVGSEGLAQTISNSFAAANIPLTEANIQGAIRAWEISSGLTTPDAGEYSYMVNNEMEPEIQNFYSAENSGAAYAAATAASSSQDPGYYADDVEGYYTKRADTIPWEGMEKQIDRILEQSGMEITEETRAAATWMLERELPVTKENFIRYQELTSVTFPLTEEQVMKAAASAIAEGKEGVAGNLAGNETIYEKAARILDKYFNKLSSEEKGGFSAIEADNLTARRQLEEIRLRMTAEVNVKLLRSGFSIDTAHMEELIEALKKAEAEVALSYFPGDPEAVEKYQSYHGTCDVVKDIPFLPADILGKWSFESKDGTLDQFHKEGTILQDTYRKAGSSYEALMTAPRADMGDHIRKAFANVDDILDDLGLECTELNRKATRILGYNRMEMTTDNLAAVKESYTQVESVVKHMAPAAVLKMIRDGINPLELSLSELDAYFKELPEEYADTAQRYSQFLYGLEQQNEITQEERDAFIGIYRLLHQIEKSDGAVVGALLNSQAEMNFANLLSAVRTNKNKHMDIKVSDAIGTLSELSAKGVSISEQIAQGYKEPLNELMTGVSGDSKYKDAYRKEQLKQIRHAGETGQDCIDMLARGELSINAGNLLAASGLWDINMNPFSRLMDKMSGQQRDAEHAEKVPVEDKTDTDVTKISERNLTMASEIENILDSLDGKKDFKSEYGKLLNYMGELVDSSSILQASSSIDVKELQLIHKQLHVMGSLAKQEEYTIPLYIGETLTAVHLTVRRGEEEQGRVDIALNIPMDNGEARVEGRFYAAEGNIRGYFSGNTEEAVRKMKIAADIFHESISKDWGVGDLQIVPSIPHEDIKVQGRHSIGHKEILKDESYSGGHKDIPTEIKDTGSYNSTSSEELYRIARYFLEAIKTA